VRRKIHIKTWNFSGFHKIMNHGMKIANHSDEYGHPTMNQEFEQPMSRSKIFSIALCVLFGLWAMPSLAIPILSISDGQGNAIAVEDQDGNDGNAAVGTVSFSGSVGQWTITVAAGVDFLLDGSAANPHIDLISLVSTGELSPSPQTLTIDFSTDYSSGFGSLFDASIGGTTDGSVIASVFADATEILNSGVITPTAGNAFAYSDTFTNPAVTDYTLTQRVRITHESGQAVATSFDYEVKYSRDVPTPGTLALLGIGLLGVAYRRIRH
jgi:hypothetical protein